MSTVVLTLAEHVALLPLADAADPPRYPSRFVGDPAPVARLKARVPETYARVTDGTVVPVGWTARSYARDEGTGEVDVEAEPTWAMLDVPGHVTVATREKLLSAVGERGPNRRHALTHAFARHGDGR
jgi:hypothetical protein